MSYNGGYVPGGGGGSSAWGGISGDIGDQTDLQNALDAKTEYASAGTQNYLPRLDANGDFVDSAVSDDGTTVLFARKAQINSSAIGNVPLTVNGFSGQTAALIEAKVNGGANVFSVSAAGAVAASSLALPNSFNIAGSSILHSAGARLNSVSNGVWSFLNASSVGGTVSFPALSPAQITSDQNNYTLASPSYFIRLSSDASRSITGFVGYGTVVNGEVHIIVNVGSNNIVLVHESGLSTAANQFLNSTGADITLSANQSAELIYDSTSSRWRVWKRN